VQADPDRRLTAAACEPTEEGAMTTSHIQQPQFQPELKRVMGFKLLLLFIVGDILGAGIYAVTGTIAGTVGGVAWLPFLIAFGVAALTALSYLELVTKYPQAAGAALYTHKAFGIHFLTFLVAFAVISSGITSASTSARLLGSNLLIGLDETVGDAGVGAISVPTSDTAGLVVALLFMVVLALINLRGVGESVKFNVVLTLVEMTALAIVIGIGLYVMARGDADLSRVTDFTSAADTNVVIAVTMATAVAFFAMVGFEDSVNMAEEVQDPQRTFPRALLGGLGLAAVIYVLVAIAVVSILSLSEIAAASTSEEGVLLSAVKAGVPDLPFGTIFPFLTVFAVANTSLINMLMASRLIYGLAKQDVVPRGLGLVLVGRRSPWAAIAFTTVLALVLIVVVSRLAETAVTALAGTTALLLLLVFSVVNVTVLVLRREPRPEGSFRAPNWTPIVGAIACLYLAGPWARARENWVQYQVAGGMLAVGIVLWAVTWFANRASGRRSELDASKLGE
jgi:basic amino acid/polyamine antiporter, APA family